MGENHIAVIDIGKTNKKVLIFNDQLKIVDSVYKTFDETIEGDLKLEPINQMEQWFKESLKTFASKYQINAISISTHGATVVCIDKNGQLALPPLSYTTEVSEDFRKEFFNTFGTPEELQQETATAEVGSLINPGKKLFFLKTRFPVEFENIQTILNYPQYWGYVLTGKKGADPTYTGCHSYLYNFKKQEYSSVAKKLGVSNKMPWPIAKSWEILGTISPHVSSETGLSTSCVVTMGIHDSNSSLLPFLVKGNKDFVLNSTGTWCVAMHPESSVSFKPDELGKLVFYNLDAFSNPVKTSIFMGGLEFEAYTTVLKKICNTDSFPKYNHALYQKIISEKKLFVLPSVVKGTGIFPTAKPYVSENGKEFFFDEIKSLKSIPDFFNDYETAFAVTVLSLVMQTKAALLIAGFNGEGSIFTEGGFRKNDAYNALLAAVFPKAKVALTRLDEATAFGAAILGKAALDTTDPMATRDLFTIEEILVATDSFTGLQHYEESFYKLIK